MYTEPAKEEKQSHTELTKYKDLSAANRANKSNSESSWNAVICADNVGALLGRYRGATSYLIHFLKETSNIGEDCCDSRLLVKRSNNEGYPSGFSILPSAGSLTKRGWASVQRSASLLKFVLRSENIFDGLGCSRIFLRVDTFHVSLSLLIKAVHNAERDRLFCEDKNDQKTCNETDDCRYDVNDTPKGIVPICLEIVGIWKYSTQL